MSASRFSFPNFTAATAATAANSDTPTHEVEVGMLAIGGFELRLELIRSMLVRGGNFLLAKIYFHNPNEEKEKLVWSFKGCGFDGIGLLAMAGDEPVVALVGKGPKGKVQKVLLLKTFVEKGGKPLSIQRQLELKGLAARFLKREYDVTSIEGVVARAALKKEQEERAAAKEADRQRREDERNAFIVRVGKRLLLTVQTVSGGMRSGVPVLEEEWGRLPRGWNVVLVESIDEFGKPGKPIEAFKIARERGQKAMKEARAAVGASTSNGKRSKGEQFSMPRGPEPVDAIVVEIDGDAYEVAVYASMDDIRAARVAGLNGGTYVTAKDRKNGDKYKILAVHREEVVDKGEFAPLSL